MRRYHHYSNLEFHAIEGHHLSIVREGHANHSDLAGANGCKT